MSGRLGLGAGALSLVGLLIIGGCAPAARPETAPVAEPAESSAVAPQPAAPPAAPTAMPTTTPAATPAATPPQTPTPAGDGVESPGSTVQARPATAPVLIRVSTVDGAAFGWVQPGGNTTLPGATWDALIEFAVARSTEAVKVVVSPDSCRTPAPIKWGSNLLAVRVGPCPAGTQQVAVRLDGLNPRGTSQVQVDPTVRFTINVGAAAGGPALPGLADLPVGGIRPGMTLAEVKQLYPGLKGQEPEYMFSGDNWAIVGNEQRVVTLLIKQPGFPTARGISVGDPVAKVKELYGEPTRLNAVSGMDYSSPNSAIGLRFTMGPDDRVYTYMITADFRYIESGPSH